MPVAELRSLSSTPSRPNDEHSSSHVSDGIVAWVPRLFSSDDEADTPTGGITWVCTTPDRWELECSWCQTIAVFDKQPFNESDDFDILLICTECIASDGGANLQRLELGTWAVFKRYPYGEWAHAVHNSPI